MPTKERVTQETQTAKTESAGAQSTDLYDAAELAANARKLFGYSPDLARAAFAYNNVDRTTRENAKKLVTQFAERKVN